ncbi:restriction endonuclease subunit S [Amycolatopsis thailandensis]|uniref:restriction endonuclease subunit S n=1 Tax=Amycolatopsis thailandensis TaxID=589330 RepID=UPI003630F692
MQELLVAEYPPGWDVLELGGVGTWLSGGTPPTDNSSYWGGKTPWISAASLKVFDISDSERRVTELGVAAGARRVSSGAVIFVVRGMSLKNEFRVGVTTRDVTFGQDCKAILPRKGINPRFLAYSLKAREDEILAMVDEAGHGTGRLSSNRLAGLEIEIPGRAQQDEIVNILDSVSERSLLAEKVVKKKQKIRSGIVESLVSGAFPSRMLGEFLELGPQNGLYKPASAYLDGKVRIVRIDSFGGGSIHSDATLLRVDASQVEVGKYGLHAGDILINRVNTVQLVGKSALVKDVREDTVFESNVMRLRVRDVELLPEFLIHVLQGARVSRYFQSSAKSAVSQASINQVDVSGCPVVVPDISSQKKVVSLMSSIDDEIRSLEDDLAKIRRIRRALAKSLIVRGC